MIDLVAQQIIGKTRYVPFHGSVEDHANALISSHNIYIPVYAV